MTICELRKKFPCHDFYYFKDGKELQKAPFYHSPIKGYQIIDDDTIFIDL